jgi:threonine dehydratase
VASATVGCVAEILTTTMRYSARESDRLGCQVYFKNEMELPTGSFKERGARNALLRLSPAQKQAGAVAASAGNHAQALAFHGRQLGVPVTVVMPKIAPLTKIQNCRDFGANVILNGNHLGQAREYAEQLAKESDLTYINGYNDKEIIAGAGTIGLEIVEQVPDVEAVVVPVGGGGLIAGISLAIKTLRPHCQIIGVEPSNVASLAAALEAGEPVQIEPGPTLADGLLVPKVGGNSFLIAQRCVDKVVSVSEKWIALAMLRLLEHEKSVVEGGGATGYAALLAGKLPELAGKKVVVPLCGGNVDMAMLGRVIDRGLAADARLIQFTATVSDRPGGIAGLTSILASEGVSIRDIFHERAWVTTTTSEVDVKIVCETSGSTHAAALFDRLSKQKDIKLHIESTSWHFRKNLPESAAADPPAAATSSSGKGGKKTS